MYDEAGFVPALSSQTAYLVTHKMLSLFMTLALLFGETKDEISSLCNDFCGFDQNADGVPEIAHVELMFEEGHQGARVLVIVEDRLVAAPDGISDILPRVKRLVADLGQEGYRACGLRMDLAESDLHQDGRYILAIRELLRAFARQDTLAGVILLGHFPDAFLVRTCNWRRKDKITLRKGQNDQASYAGNPYLRRVPEDVAHRADIVLSDLGGHWEDLYIQPRTRLETVTAVFADEISPSGGPCIDLSRGSVIHEDFFHLSDGKLEIRERLDKEGSVLGHSLFLDDSSADHECSDDEGDRPNPLSIPDILISRIDAWGTALRPRKEIVGQSGEGLLDEKGQPQAVQFASKDAVPSWNGSIWEQDEEFERRLLIEYLDRNHAYRTRAAHVAWRPSSIACELGSGFREMSRASVRWDPQSDDGLADISGSPTLAKLTSWLAYPAVLRTLRAHSDSWGSVFKRAKVETFAEQLGGPPWSWTQRGDRLEPSLQSACGGGKLDWFLLHTLWKNGAIAQEPCFYNHTGCHGISPPNAVGHPFNHPSYGRRQGAEALLLFGNGLALIGRSKVFYDEPKGFAQALAEGRTFGAAWASYFEIESMAESWGKAGGDIGRKRSYFWSVLGDWTLKLSTAEPPR